MYWFIYKLCNGILYFVLQVALNNVNELNLIVKCYPVGLLEI